MLVCTCMREGSIAIWNSGQSVGSLMHSIYCSCMPFFKYVKSEWCHLRCSFLWLWLRIAEIVACPHDLADCQVCIQFNLDDCIVWNSLYCISTCESCMQLVESHSLLCSAALHNESLVCQGSIYCDIPNDCDSEGLDYCIEWAGTCISLFALVHLRTFSDVWGTSFSGHDQYLWSA